MSQKSLGTAGCGFAEPGEAEDLEIDAIVDIPHGDEILEPRDLILEVGDSYSSEL